MFTYNDSLYSDLHKDARGVRPGDSGFNYWSSLTPAEKQTQWDSLIVEMNQRYEDEQKEQKLAVERFEAQIEAFIKNGAKDRKMAIRWIFDAEEVHPEDPDYLCYRLDLPYGYVKE